MIKKFSFPTKRNAIPMKQEEPPVDEPVRVQKPKWVRWSTVDGKLRRDWFPGFLMSAPSAGWAAEGSAEERAFRDGQLAAPF